MAVKAEHTAQLQVDIKKKLKGFELSVAFTAQPGCLGILGPSGCGKSMTLKSVAGLVDPDQGRIALQYASGEAAGGRVLYDSSRKICLRPQKRRVGYLFQNYALFPNMTVTQNIMAGMDAGSQGKLSAGAKKEKLGELIEKFRLQGLEQRRPAQLSGGQQQRAALARMLASDPEILLLDEPFSAMDTYLREGLRLELARMLKTYERISILVTHDRDEAFQLCSHLVLMDQGRVLTMGRTRDVFENPGTCQAARLTGCKNISRIRRIGPNRIQALDWNGLQLETDRPVGDQITAVGIRAHDFCPLSEGEAEKWRQEPMSNLIPVENPRVSEMPFEWYITLENGLWWKTEKTIWTHTIAGQLPPWLRIPPQALLLLTGEL